MRKLLVVAAVAALLAIGAGTVARAGTSYTRVVSPDGNGCAGASSANNYTTIDDALAAAQPNDSVFACAGTYPEVATPIITQAGLSLLGPGATPADDGTTVVQIHDPQNTGVIIDADNVTVSGLTFDLTAAGQPATGATGFGQTLTITDLIIIGATSYGIYFNYNGPYVFDNNSIDTDSYGIFCLCADSEINGNTLTNTSGTAIPGITASGSGNTVSGNTVSGGDVTTYGPGVTVTDNTLDGEGFGSGFSLGFGMGIVFSGNTAKNVPANHFALSVDEYNGQATSVTITRNTFQADGNPIILDDQDANDGAGINVTTGGTAPDANVFVGSGGNTGDAQLLLQLDGVAQDQDAQYNNWGLCSAADIAQEIQDHADVPSLGTVDYSNFIAPDTCGGTGTPTPTGSASPTPSPTPSGAHGDANCDGHSDERDAMAVLTQLAGVSPGAPCASQADMNCNGSLDADDALRILTVAADLPTPSPSACFG